MKSSLRWTVGELAARFDRPTHVLRHWEHVGLLDPARDSAGRRSYGRDDLTRVAVIVRGKAAGIGLDQLKAFLDADPATRRTLLRNLLRFALYFVLKLFAYPNGVGETRDRFMQR